MANPINIPILHTKGTHYEVGKDIGHTFQKQIREYCDKNGEQLKVIEEYVKSSEGNKILAEYEAVISSNYPQYLEELRGIADGSGISYHTLLMNMLDGELLALLPKPQEGHSACTDILVCRNDCVAIGHTEDGYTYCKDLCYIVSAEIINDRPRGKLTIDKECFTCYVYPGELPGWAFGFNHHGLVFSINALNPTRSGRHRTGHRFLTRAMLSARNVEEVEAILTDECAGNAFGDSVNMSSLQDQHVYNIEVGPCFEEKRSSINVKCVRPDVEGGFYYHVNMYRRLDVEERGGGNDSSRHRAARISTVKDTEGILRTLGDRHDKQYPIYRDNEINGSSTLCTALFDLKKRVLEIYTENPARSRPVHTFNLTE